MISTYLWLLYQIRTYLTVQHKLLYYNAYIKSHFEYCCVVLGNSCNYNAYRIEKLQRRACKLILGNDYSSLDAARKRLNILLFEETIFIHKAKVMYKIAHNTAPIYLADLFQMRGNGNNLNDSQLNLRSTSNKNFPVKSKPKTIFLKAVFFMENNSGTIESFTNNCLKWIKCDSAS